MFRTPEERQASGHFKLAALSLWKQSRAHRSRDVDSKTPIHPPNTLPKGVKWYEGNYTTLSAWMVLLIHLFLLIVPAWGVNVLVLFFYCTWTTKHPPFKIHGSMMPSCSVAKIMDVLDGYQRVVSVALKCVIMLNQCVIITNKDFSKTLFRDSGCLSDESHQDARKIMTIIIKC